MNPNHASTDVVIIGAGLSGLAAASRLNDDGLRCTVVEKARGPGGRMSTRRHAEWRFDHGAQYFTARETAFRATVDEWLERGWVRRWEARVGVIEGAQTREAGTGTERFIGVPGMSAPCSELASSLPDVRFGWRAAACARTGAGWAVRSTSGETLSARFLVVTIPPRQALDLIVPGRLTEALASVRMLPCWAVLAVFDQPLLPDWDAAFVNGGPLSWMAAQRGRPGRPDADAWVLHAASDWTIQQLETEPEAVADLLLSTARKLPGAAPVRCAFVRAHRWRFALAENPLEEGCLWDTETRLAIAGDWCRGSRVEGAFLSGRAAAERISGA